MSVSKTSRRYMAISYQSVTRGMSGRDRGMCVGEGKAWREEGEEKGPDRRNTER